MTLSSTDGQKDRLEELHLSVGILIKRETYSLDWRYLQPVDDRNCKNPAIA